MVRKIIYSSIFILMLFSLSLYLFGVEHVELGAPFLAFLRNCSRELNNFKIAIPNIPLIPRLDDVGGILLVIDVLIAFFNGVINVLNFIVLIFNTVIEMLQFIFIILKNLISMRDELLTA